MHIEKRGQAGFTLVEIAIVLVIIGLLLGGILKGQEMITQARIKNVTNDFNGTTAAYFSYQDRYKAVPGDDGNAGTRWNTFGVRSGNSDGSISGEYKDSADPAGFANDGNNESQKFWWHLRASGFIPGPTQGTGSATPPNNAVGGLIGVQNGAFSGATALTGLVVCSSNIPDKIAAAVDTQLDDQRSNAGSMRAHTQAATNPSVTAASGATQAAAYVEDGTTQYTICKTV
ncbi:MAG: prepilin-type N-terminal cleavage/methylation domain-containing protein [Burkholderiales bacterium]|nr:prepilin-type N-terminal cleavage/methylation domain-containing protein [Burkholderiales bacterium]